MKKTNLSAGERLDLITNLETMLSAGVPILEVVEALFEDSKGNPRKILDALRKDLNQGKKVSESFERFPRAFDPISVNLIKAAEETGNLEVVLKDLNENLKKDMEFVSKVKTALTYPSLVLFVFATVLLINLVYVIPRISRVFTKLKVTLPLPTRIMIATSNFFLNFLPFIIIFFILLVILLIFSYKTKRRELLGVLTSLPVVSRLAVEIDITRFSRTLSLLLRSGLPITRSLDLAYQVVAKKKVAQAIENANKMVTSGKSLSEGLKKSKGVIPVSVISIIEASEKSGNLEQAMQNVSDRYELRVTNTLKTLTTLMEPIILIVMGVLMAGMMLALLAPIYQLIGSINVR